MGCFSSEERNTLVDLVAQAVIDKIEERERVNRLAEMVIQRVIELQAEEAKTQASAEETVAAEKKEDADVSG